MITSQTGFFDVPAALATIVNIREVNSWQRSLFFENKSSSTLSIQMEHSADGGTTWSIIGTAFTLVAGAKIEKEISTTYPNQLRIRASGGGEDRDLVITYARMFGDGDTWTNPTL